MAVLETLRSFFGPGYAPEPEVVVPAPSTEYHVKPLTKSQLPEVLRLNIRCFRNGDNYTKHTFEYLLNEPRTLSYRTTTPDGELVGFAFAIVKENNSAHLTTIGIAPEHRRRGLAESLMRHMENALQKR